MHPFIFLYLTADKEIHKERFVKRAMKIKRGGKHLEYFKENRIINDYLVKSAVEHGVPVINNIKIESSLKRMLTLIREICKVMLFKHSVDQLEDETSIILDKYGGRMVDVSYFLPGFGEPLKRKVNVFDPVEARRFIDRLEKNPKRKKDLENLYSLSDNIHSHKICAPDKESLENMIKDLDEKGFIYKNKKNKNETDSGTGPQTS